MTDMYNIQPPLIITAICPVYFYDVCDIIKELNIKHINIIRYTDNEGFYNYALLIYDLINMQSLQKLEKVIKSNTNLLYINSDESEIHMSTMLNAITLYEDKPYSFLENSIQTLMMK